MRPSRLRRALPALLLAAHMGAPLAQDDPVTASAELAPDTAAGACLARGWQRVVLPVDGLPRELLWQAPAGGWRRGAVLVLHGGGGRHDQWCATRSRLLAPQVRFSEAALAEGFAVFLLDASDRVTDRQGRPCGKVWDDEVRNRPNLDLPFIGAVIGELLPRLRPAGSPPAVFLTGLSSGGYMTVRAATHFDDRVTAFASAASGDPYGWHRLCEPGRTLRRSVHGVGVDNETGREIPEREACRAARYPNEQPWDSARPPRKPAFLVLRHAQDGIHDRSCSQKVSTLLRRHGYPGWPDVELSGGRRGPLHHFWQDAYTRPVLDFFAAQLQPAR